LAQAIFAHIEVIDRNRPSVALNTTMASRVVATVLFAAACASGLIENTWGPDDSVHALDSVISAVNDIASNPHLTPEKLARAKAVAADVKADVEAVESGKLSKDEGKAKVSAAITEMTSFSAEISKGLNLDGDVSGKKAKLDDLEKQLAGKKAELAKDENMIKLVTLKKQLMEKKMMLQKLLDQKAAAAQNHKGDEAEAKATNDMVQQLVGMAKGLKVNSTKNSTTKSDGKQDLPASLKTILASVTARRKDVQASLAKMELQDKMSEAALEMTIDKPVPTQGKDDALLKSKSMLMRLKKEEHRKFAKAQAVKRLEVAELKDAEDSIEARDVNKLQKALSKIESEGKALQTKAGKFLY